MVKRDPKDTRNFVIIGSGIAGLNAAETLRYSGYTGKITMINGEKMLPYDRTMLTKQLAVADAEKLQLRDKEWFKEADIDMVHDRVYSIHTDIKKLAMERGEAIAYDKLLIATGGSAKKSTIPGADARNVFYLRSAADQAKIKARANEVK
jgi:NAD(P)H-nitrite reductase large subunit